MKQLTAPNSRRQLKAFTLMEILVVIAIIIVLASIAYPVIVGALKKGYKIQALTIMKNLSGAGLSYMKDHDGVLPDEDVNGSDSWTPPQSVPQDKVWYNSLPRILNAKGVVDFVTASQTAKFYSKENILFLPGAQYPRAKMMSRPFFSIAINTKIHRHPEPGKPKPEVRLANIKLPSRTVFFLEQGLPGEEPAHPTQSKGDYDGSCKGSAKSFVARYNGRGTLSFFDGHCEEVAGKDLLDTQGKFIYDENVPSGIFWCADTAESPNRVETAAP